MTKTFFIRPAKQEPVAVTKEARFRFAEDYDRLMGYRK